MNSTTFKSGARAPIKFVFYTSEALKEALQKNILKYYGLQKWGARAGKVNVLQG